MRWSRASPCLCDPGRRPVAATIAPAPAGSTPPVVPRAARKPRLDADVLVAPGAFVISARRPVTISACFRNLPIAAALIVSSVPQASPPLGPGTRGGAMIAIAGPGARRPLHPLHAILLAFPFPLFLGALLSDFAYGRATRCSGPTSRRGSTPAACWSAPSPCSGRWSTCFAAERRASDAGCLFRRAAGDVGPRLRQRPGPRQGRLGDDAGGPLAVGDHHAPGARCSLDRLLRVSRRRGGMMRSIPSDRRPGDRPVRLRRRTRPAAIRRRTRICPSRSAACCPT